MKHARPAAAQGRAPGSNLDVRLGRSGTNVFQHTHGFLRLATRYAFVLDHVPHSITRNGLTPEPPLNLTLPARQTPDHTEAARLVAGARVVSVAGRGPAERRAVAPTAAAAHPLRAICGS